MELQQTSLRRFRSRDRADYERIFDVASTFRWDDTVALVCEEWERRRDKRRAAPTPVSLTLLGMVGGPQTVAAQFRALFRSDSVGVADVWTDASNVTVVSSKTYSLNDRIDTSHIFLQAASGNQAAQPAADSGINNALAVPFAANGWYDSTRGVAAWKRFTDGTGCELSNVYTPTAVHTGSIVGTSDLGTVAQVAFFHFLNTSNQLSWGVYNGAATSHQGYVGPYAANTPTYDWECYVSPPLTNSSQAGFKEASVNVSDGQAPSSGNPAYTMRIGAAQPTNAYRLQARWRASYFWHRKLSAAERTVRQQFINADTLIA